MRLFAVAAVVLVIACSPKHIPPPSVENEVGTESKSEPATAAEAIAEAPPGRGMRKGTIERAKLLAVLKKGPGAFLGQLELAPQMEGKRFVGWQLVRILDRNGPLADVDVIPGDILVAVNGNSVSRPEQLQTLWDSLRSANSLDAVLRRGGARLKLAFAIEPPAR